MPTKSSQPCQIKHELHANCSLEPMPTTVGTNTETNKEEKKESNEKKNPVNITSLFNPVTVTREGCISGFGNLEQWMILRSPYKNFAGFKGDITCEGMCELFSTGCKIYDYPYELDEQGKSQMNTLIKSFGDKTPFVIGFILVNWKIIAHELYVRGQINKDKYGEPPKKPYMGMIANKLNREIIRELINIYIASPRNKSST